MGSGATKSKRSLHLAAKQGDLCEVKRKLVADKVHVDSIDEFDCSALYWACHKGHLEMVKFLLQHDAHVELANKDGESDQAHS